MLLVAIGLLFGVVMLIWCLVISVMHADSRSGDHRGVTWLDHRSSSMRSKPRAA